MSINHRLERVHPKTKDDIMKRYGSKIIELGERVSFPKALNMMNQEVKEFEIQLKKMREKL